MHSKSCFPNLKSQAILSPMSGVTDVAFRALAKKYGAGLTYTEFTSGASLIRGKFSALKRIVIGESETPVAVQLFGSNVDEVIGAAKLIQAQFDVIDINCGCPSWKVIRGGSGSEMLKHPDKIASFVNKLVSAINKPVTVKIRSGIDENKINAVEVAKLVEDAGASAIAVHGRTRNQGYSGSADWNVIKSVKDAVNIPVIGNGDVFTPENFKEKLDFSGVDYIMIARGAIGNPFIFWQINDFLKTGKYEKEDRLKLFAEYIELAKKYCAPFASIKNHAMDFTKTLRGGGVMRQKLIFCKNVEEVCNILSLK